MGTLGASSNAICSCQVAQVIHKYLYYDSATGYQSGTTVSCCGRYYSYLNKDCLPASQQHPINLQSVLWTFAKVL